MTCDRNTTRDDKTEKTKQTLCKQDLDVWSRVYKKNYVGKRVSTSTLHKSLISDFGLKQIYIFFLYVLSLNEIMTVQVM